MEPGEVARWQRRLGAGWKVIPRTRFGARYGLAKAFRGSSRPDMVAVNRRRRRVLVGDVTARPDADHLAKTIGYARRLAGRLPDSLQGYRVLAQDWYWALPPEWGPRSWPTSKRIVVRPHEGEGFTPRVLAVIANSVLRGGRPSPLYRVAPRRLNQGQARRAVRTRAGVFLEGASKDQARQWLLSMFPGANPRTLCHEAHRGGRGHWHVGAGDERTGHVFYGRSRPQGAFFAQP
jgi:hypothetical protein